MVAFCGDGAAVIKHRNERDIGGNGELGRHVPAGLIKQENGVFAGGDGLANFLKM